MHEALFWERGKGTTVHCLLCRQDCHIVDGLRGLCGVRENRGGTLYTLVYGLSVAEHVDPIEKKPLYHFYPGSRSYSIATVGCNFRCKHCQNFGISQIPRESHTIVGDPLPPEQVVKQALANDCRSIAYTYTEPTIYFEYAFDTAVLARQAGLANLFVSNGYITTPPLEQIAPYLDAANIDLKSFDPKIHRELTGAHLDGVLAGLRDYRRLGIWLEVTTLVIPGINDSDDELAAMAGFICNELGSDTPWHVTAFFPTHQLHDYPATPAHTLQRAHQLGLAAGLRYVYQGNLSSGEGENTFCPGCGDTVISRHGFHVGQMALRNGCCRSCGAVIAGIGLP